MINKAEYKLLKRIAKNKSINYDNQTEMTTLSHLHREHLIQTNQGNLRISDLGIREIEEYRRTFWKIKKENFAIVISIIALVISLLSYLSKMP